MAEKKTKTKKVTTGNKHAIARLHIIENVYSYEDTNNTVKEKKENADITD